MKNPRRHHEELPTKRHWPSETVFPQESAVVTKTFSYWKAGLTYVFFAGSAGFVVSDCVLVIPPHYCIDKTHRQDVLQLLILCPIRELRQ